MMSKLFLFVPVCVITACATTPKQGDTSRTDQRRVFLDSSTHEDALPTWAKDNKIVWEANGKVYFHSTHTVLGSQSVDGCYDLAKLDGTEKLLSEIADD